MHAVLATSRWGLLPVALVLAALLAVRVGAITSARAPSHERLLTGATLALGAIVLGVRMLAALALLTPAFGFGLLCVATLAAHVMARRQGEAPRTSWRRAVTTATWPLLVVAVLGVGYAAVAAYLLPVWQWDALGYHLPFVAFALQDHSLAGVPPDVPYLATYPHVVELLFAGWRMMLPDDRLVDAAQLPLGLFGALAVAALARQADARAEDSVAAGAAWLAVPAVFLQLPTNYVDVASAGFALGAAYFVLAEPSRLRVVVAGVALGLLLGSKPNAPVATTLLFALLGFRALRSEPALWRWLLIAACCTLLIGAESFLVNTARHHNPIWPVHVVAGPIELPGTLPMSTLLESGANAPRLHGPVVLRVLRSWTTFDAPPVFDMRFGGMGGLFVLALPAALWLVWKRRSWPLAVVLAAALASPDPAVPRYVLAVPGVAFALAAPWLRDARPRLRGLVFGLSAVLAAVALVRASPGITGEGPPLSAYFGMTEAERANAVGADGRPTRFLEARARVRPGELTLFDASSDLPYLAWPSDLSNRVERIPDAASEGEVAQWLDQPTVRLLVVGDDLPAGVIARKRPDLFSPLFHCKSSSCTVYARQ